MLILWHGSPARRKGSRAAHGRLRVEALEGRDLPSFTASPMYVLAEPFGSPGPGGYSPTQVRHAYGFDQISLPGGAAADGTGTTIAIVDAFDDPRFVSSTDASFVSSDLHHFDLAFGLPDPPSFVKMNQTGGTTGFPPLNAGWDSEIALDVEWAHAIAPKANIILVEANDNGGNNLLAAVATAAKQPGVVAVSMSFGGSEFSGETSDDSTFT